MKLSESNIIRAAEKRIVLIALLAVTCVYLKHGIGLKRWDTTKEINEQLIRSDAIDYYGYLPAVFIYKDLRFSFLNYKFPEGYISRFWVKDMPGGYKVPKMTMGLAIALTPGFFAGHAIATLFHYPADGFSPPYQLCLWLWVVFLAIYGLAQIAGLLQFYGIHRYAIALTILSLGLATNLYNYSTNEAGMTHAVLFALCAILIKQLYLLMQSVTLRRLYMAAFALGLITLIRPTDGILVFLPVFFIRKHHIKDIINCVEKRFHWFFILFTACTPVLLQMVYWKISTGHYFYDGYEPEHFFFNRVQWFDYLFSYRKGWLVYTPVMLFGLSGLILLYRRFRWPAIGTIMVIGITIFLHSSWWCWWFGGSFGARAMIDFYPLLAFPMALCFEILLARKILWQKLMPVAFCAFFAYMNIIQTRQYEIKLLHWDANTKESYWKIFLRFQWPENLTDYHDVTDPDSAMQGKVYH